MSKFTIVINFLAFIMSAIAPQLTRPQAANLNFTLSGSLAGMAGFCMMYMLLSYWKESIFKKLFVAMVVLIVGIFCANKYIALLFSEENVTPSLHTEWVMLILFISAYFLIFAFLAFAIRNGGMWLIRRFDQFQP